MLGVVDGPAGILAGDRPASGDHEGVWQAVNGVPGA
jgi:hypothetical protein